MEKAEARKELDLRDAYEYYELEAVMKQVRQKLMTTLFVNEGMGEKSGKRMVQRIAKLEDMEQKLPLSELRRDAHDFLVEARGVADIKGEITKLWAGVVCSLALVADLENRLNDARAENRELRKQLKENQKGIIPNPQGTGEDMDV